MVCMDALYLVRFSQKRANGSATSSQKVILTSVCLSTSTTRSKLEVLKLLVLKSQTHAMASLLKHFEVLYQDGDMTLLPCREENPLAQERNTIRVQIHIAEKFHNTFLQWVYAKTEVTKNPEKEWCVHSVEPVRDKRGTIKYPEKLIKLGELHEKVIKICPQPFMRSLYMQARMAHKQHPDLPDPDTMLDVFKSQCPDKMDYVRQCLGIGGQIVADAIVEEPIEWDEDK